MSITGTYGVPFQRVESNNEVFEFDVEATSAGNFADDRGDLEARIEDRERVIGGLDGQIDTLTNHSDQLDISIAVASGVVAGAVDSFWVGEFSLLGANQWGSEQVNKMVMKVAQHHGYTGSDMSGAIRKLEKTFKFAGDQATASFGGGRLHHLRDFTHHPSPAGLLASLMLQFTGHAWGVTSGQFALVNLSGNEGIGSTVYEKFYLGTIKWIGHLISDVAGSSTNAGGGTGLPGPLMEMAQLAAGGWQKIKGAEGASDLSAYLEKAFLGSEGRVPFDFRTELGLVNQAGRQALPVILNDVIVRAFYFVRRLIAARAAGLSWRESIVASRPWRNRTITRMLTIATATFTAVDLADAAVRAAIASGGEPTTFAGKFLLRVNYVGAVRTTVAVVVDVSKGVKRNNRDRERSICVNERMRLLNARTFYCISDTWTAAESSEQALILAEAAVRDAGAAFRATWAGTLELEQRVVPLVEEMRESNPELTLLLLQTLQGRRHV